MGVFRERRRAPRELAGLHGRYLVARVRELGWHDCSFVDVSELGAGARLRGPAPEVGDEIFVLLDDPPEAATLPIRAFVRHARADYFGAIRVGIEFEGLQPVHREALLSALRSGAVSQLTRRTPAPGVRMSHRVL